MEVYLHAFLTSVLDGSDQLHAPATLHPWETTPSIYCIGGWVGLRASLYAVAKRKFPAPSGNRTSVVKL
jgi:hypothetical protein